VAAWIHPRFARRKFPDYMRLGEKMFDEPEIEKWMKDEYYFRGGKKFGCGPRFEKPEVLEDAEKLPGNKAEAKEALLEKIQQSLVVQKSFRALRMLVLKKAPKQKNS
jgi:hypothetical protein